MKSEYWLLLSATIIAAFIFCGCAGSLPKDRDARAFYFENKQTLQKILEMLEQDGVLDKAVVNSKEAKGPSFVQDVCVIDAANTNILANLSLDSGRREEYRRTFASLKKYRGAFIYKNTGRVYLILASSGLVISGGSYKGIAYVPRPADYPSNAIVSSLDGKRVNDLDGTFLVPIEGGWYIYYDCIK